MRSSLNLATLILAFAVAAVALILFLKKRSNRHHLDGRAERNIAADLDEGRSSNGSSFSDRS
jgi:hypothetical protein